MDNDVSVARLSDDDGWNDRPPPGPNSRMRMLAVMGAVVVGCGVAAIVVNLAPSDPSNQADDGGERIVVIDPSRTDLYPTGTTAPTTDDDLPTGTSDPTQQISSSPQDGNLGGGGDPGETESHIPDDSDEDGDDGDEDSDDGGDEDGDDPGEDDTGEPTTSAPSSPPDPTSTPPSSTPPTTTPPEDDEDEDEECTPSWWIGCWF